MSTSAPSAAALGQGLAGLAARSRTNDRKRLGAPVGLAHSLQQHGSINLGLSHAGSSSHLGSGAVDLSSTLSSFGYSTGFETGKFIEEFYSRHPIKESQRQREELSARRALVVDALRSYAQRHYPSFIATSEGVQEIEAECAKLHVLLEGFSVGLKALASSSGAFSYDDARLSSQLAAIESSSAASSSSDSSSALPPEAELEELVEGLRGLVYERRFDQAVSQLETALSRARARAKELKKLQAHSPSSSSSQSQQFKALAMDLLGLRHTLIEMLYAELRSCATTSGRIGRKAGASGASSSASSPRNASRRASSDSADFGSSSSSSSSSNTLLPPLVTHLLSLGQTRRTLQVFLYSVKSSHVRASIRGIKFTGDVVGYVQELSRVFFGGVSQAIDEFGALFRHAASVGKSGGSSSGGTVENPLAHGSYLLRWVLHELVGTYGSIFHKQVFQSEGTFSKLGKCLRCAFNAASALESRSTGVQLGFCLAGLFAPGLKDVVDKNYAHVWSLVGEEVAVEGWRVAELWVSEKDKSASAAAAAAKDSASSAPVVAKKKRALRLTSSAKYLYDVVRNLLREVVPILEVSALIRGEMYPPVVQGMTDLFEKYCLRVAQEASNPAGGSTLDDVQALSVVANVFYLTDDLLPRVTKEFRKQFGSKTGGSSGGGGSLPELEALHERLYDLHRRLRGSFISRRSASWIPGQIHLLSTLVAGKNKYANPMSLSAGLGGEVAGVSSEWTDFAEGYLPTLHKNASKVLGDQAPGLVESMVEQFFQAMGEGDFARLQAAEGRAGGEQASSFATPASSSSSSSFWTTYVFGLGGLQQFVFDVRFFARSAGAVLAGAGLDEIKPGGFVTARAALSATQLLRQSIASYASKTHTKADDAWMQSSFRWIEASVEKRVANNKAGNLAKVFLAEREREKAEREEAARAAAAASAAASPRAGPSSSKAASSASPSSSAMSPSANPTSIAPLQRGIRRGSTITAEQFALMNAATPIAAVEGDGNEDAGSKAAAAFARRKPAAAAP